MALAENQGQNGSVFVSYSRKDKEFVQKLVKGLEASNIKVWVDWEGIPPSADWMAEITSAVRGSDAFITIISPDWLASKVCANEYSMGLDNNKKLVPILYRDPENSVQMPEKLSATNWIYLRTQDDFEAGLAKTVEAIATDLDWIKEQTRLLQRANEWDAKKRNTSFLLQGADLEDAEHWMTEAAIKPNRDVLPLQAEYIHASRKQQVHRQRNLIVGVSIAFAVSVALGILALFQRNIAVTNEQLAKDNEKLAQNNAATAVANENARATQQAIAISNETAAKAQRSAAEAKLYQGQAGQLDLSTLLALDSWQRAQLPQAEDILRQNISLLPKIVDETQQTDWINKLTVSPDGKTFFTASVDKTACLWNISDGTKRFCLQLDGAVNDSIFTEDGKYLVTASADGTLRIWNPTDGSLIKRFDFGSSIEDVDCSPDSKMLAIGRDDGVITLIKLQDLNQKPVNITQHGIIYDVDFSPDGKLVGAGTSLGKVFLWNLNQGYGYYGPEHKSDVYAIAFSPDSHWIVSGGADSTTRAGLTSSGGQKYVLPEGDWVEDLAFAPDGTWFVTASDDNTVRVFDTATGKEKLRMQHDGFAQRVSISPDGQWIASTGTDHTVRIWDAASGAQMMQIPITGNGSALSFDRNGQHLIAGDSLGHNYVWDITALSARVNYIQFPELVRQAKFDPSGSWMAVNTDEKLVWSLTADQILHAHSGAVGTKVLNAGGLTLNLQISPNSGWLAVTTKDDKKAILQNLNTNKSVNLIQNYTTNDVAFSPDSKMAATAGENSVVSLWNTESGNKLIDLSNPSPVKAVAFGMDNNTLAAGLDNQIIIWNIAKQAQTTTINNTGVIKVIKYSQDGNWLIAGNTEGNIFFWNAKGTDFSTPAFVLNENGQVLSIAFSPDGKWLATGSSDRFAYIWNINTKEEAARIPHVDEVTSVSFSKDGSLLATASKKVIEIWNFNAIPRIPNSEMETAACARLGSNPNEAEWQSYFANDPYHAICPNLPLNK